MHTPVTQHFHFWKFILQRTPSWRSRHSLSLHGLSGHGWASFSWSDGSGHYGPPLQCKGVRKLLTCWHTGCVTEWESEVPVSVWRVRVHTHLLGRAQHSSRRGTREADNSGCLWQEVAGRCGGREVLVCAPLHPFWILDPKNVCSKDKHILNTKRATVSAQW